MACAMLALFPFAVGCRGSSPTVEPERRDARREKAAAPAPPSAWRTPRLAWRIDGVDILTFVSGSGASVFPTESAGALLAIDLHTGKKRWEHAAADLIPYSLVIAGDLVVFSQRSGKVTALALADGSVRWSTDAGCAFAWPGAGEGVVAGTCDDQTVRPVRHGVAALDLATGEPLFRREMADSVTSSEPGIDGKTVYFAREDGKTGQVVAVDRSSGRERWRTPLPQSVTAARVVGEVVIARGFDTHGLRASDGTVLWTAKTGDRTSFWIERSVVLHDGLVACPRDGAVDGIDPKTGKVAATWTVPAVAAASGRNMNGLWEVGGRLVAHVLGMGGPGHLVVWSGQGAALLATPPGVVNSIHDDVVLQTMGTGDGMTTVRGLLLAGDPPSRPVVTRAAAPARTNDCETDQYEAQNAGSLEMLKDSISARAVLPHGDHLYWASRKGVVWRVRRAGGAAEEMGAIESSSLLAIDEDFYYWAECGTGGCGHHGDNQALVRVSRADGSRRVLADRLGIVHVAVIDRGDLYIGTWDDDYGATGSVARVSRKGGSLATLWKGGAVEDLLVDRDRVLAVSRAEVVAIPRGRGKPIAVASGLDHASAVAVDATHVYVAERGDPYWQSADSGYLVRVPRQGGKPERILGPVRWPEGVAVIGERVLVGLDKGDIVSVGKAGGSPAVLVRETRTESCRDTLWMRALGGSLYWLRRADQGRGILWRLRP